MEDLTELVDGKEPDGSERVIKIRVRTMPAYEAEQWLYRALLALGKGFGGSLGDIQKDHSKLISAIAGLKYEDAKPLLDELLACCDIVNGKQTVALTPQNCRLIQSPMTLIRLRLMSAKKNLAFFTDGGGLTSLMDSLTA